jgi:uncharacterized protein YfiM (DUF2279 family)
MYCYWEYILNFNLTTVNGRMCFLLLVTGFIFLHLPLRAQVVTQDSARKDFTIHRLTVGRSGQSGGLTDAWLGDDKFRHVIGSLMSTVLLTQLGDRGATWDMRKAKVVAAGTTFSFGFVKEIYDRGKPGNHFCWKDLTADALGILLGLLILDIN